MKLDEELTRSQIRPLQLLDHLVLGPFDIQFEQIDVLVPQLLHNRIEPLHRDLDRLLLG